MNPSIDLKQIKMKIPLSPLNAIYEKDEDENTETIRNMSERKDIYVINSPSNPKSPPIASNKAKERKSQISLTKQSDPFPVLTLQPTQRIEPSRSRNNQNESNQTNTCLSLGTKDSLVVLPEQVIYMSTNPNSVTFKEVCNYYSSFYLESKVSICNKVKESPSSNNHHLCCLKRFVIKHMSRYRLDKDLKSDKLLLVFLSQISFDINNDLHWKMAQTIYHYIKDANNNTNNNGHFSVGDNCSPRREGNEWSFLFESNTPDFPLANGGIYSMVQMLYLIEKHPNYFKELNLLFFNEQRNKNYIIDFLSLISALCLEYVNNNDLNSYFNQKKNLQDTILDFYLGFIYQTHIYLTKEPIVPFTFDLVHNAFEKTKKDARKTPSSILWKCNQFKENYPDEANSNILTKSCAD